MTLPETRPATKAATGVPIGLERPLSMAEETNIFIIGKPRKELAGMTPESLEVLADATADNSNNFLGS